MRVEDFDYYLPEELIAQEPLDKRDQSRLLVLNRQQEAVEHSHFSDLPKILGPGDTLVLNNSRVIPARLWARRASTGGQVETLLLKPLAEDRWEVLVKPGRRAPVGEKLVYGDGELSAEVLDRTEAGGRVIQFSYNGSFREQLLRLGEMPLPPYIQKKLADPERYQTVYAQQDKEGSVAAPTAGLHFTADMLTALQERGVRICYITLHVGLGTFRPVQVEEVTEHKMHGEFYEVTPEVAEIINATKAAGGRVVAVGTTVVRVLETVATGAGQVAPGQGWSELFIYPGFTYQIVDAMITNFHLPRSTLMMLVSALAGRDLIMKAYQEAVQEQYRFFSFGDAMLIL